MPSGLYIAGKWQSGQQQLSVSNKYTGQVIGQVAMAGPQAIEQALDSARRGAQAMEALPTHRRSDLLLRAASSISQRREALAKTIAEEAGKPIKFARAEVDRATMTFQLAGEEARRLHGETMALDAVPAGENFFGFWWRKPVGVVAAISPFNFPLNLVAHKIAPALAAGNAFLLKPAAATPLTAVALFEILLEAGMPAEAGQLLPGSGQSIGQAIVSDARVDKVTFTGSAVVGRQILAQAGIKRVTLELGNSSPVIVAADADLELAAQRCATGAFAYSGQVCISVQRIYVDRRIEDEFRRRLLDATRGVSVGDPLSEQTDVGPMIASSEAERADQWVREAEQGGARCLIGGHRDGAIYYPSILESTSPEMRVVKDEVFAPVAALIPFTEFDEALRAAGGTQYGLQAGLFTRDIDRCLRAIRSLNFGGVIINDAPSFRADHMPYGGTKQSGLGREGVRFAMEEMTNIQTVAIRTEADS